MLYRTMFWFYCVYFEQVKYKNESKLKQHKIFVVLINWTKIGRSTCCQLHRLARLKKSARRYIAWRQNWNICLTVLILWIYLRLENIGIKYFRNMGIWIPKYTVEHWTYSALHYIFLGLVLPWNKYTFEIYWVLSVHIFVCK